MQLEPGYDPKLCIIGSGFSGICAAVKLRENFPNLDFVIFEANDEVGGTWWANTYPGCACDIPSHLYSFSFELHPDWPEAFSCQEEILKYLIKVVDKHNLRKYVRFNTYVSKQQWHDQLNKWRLVHTDKLTGEQSQSFFDIVIDSIGPLRVANIPKEFMGTPFKGSIIHSAEWDPSVDLTNKRVALVGTGASAIQILPAIADSVKQVEVFQRKAAWTVFRGQYTFSPLCKWLFRQFPFLMRIYRCIVFYSNEFMHGGFKIGTTMHKLATLEHFHALSCIKDEALRKKLTPDYPFGCKRVLLTDNYLQCFAKPNVRLWTEPMEQIVENGVVVDGKLVELDAIVLATGYKAQDFFAPMQIVGRNNYSLYDAWMEFPKSYLGITVARAPNAFITLGPNTGLGHNSIIFMIECQVSYIMKLLREFFRRKATTVEVSEEAQDAFVASVREGLKNTVWASGDCGSWYANAKGEVTVLWPHTCMCYAEETSKVDFSKFNFT